MKRIAPALCQLAVSCLLAPTTALAQTTLAQAIEQTIATNPDVLTAATDRLAVEQRVRQARAGYLPSIDLNAGWGGEEANNRSTRSGITRWESVNHPGNYVKYKGTSDMLRSELGAKVTQMIFDGFETANEVRRRQSDLEAKSYTVFGMAENVALDATQAYTDVLKEQDLVKLAQDNLATHEKTLEQIKLRSQVGVGRKADETQAEGRLALARSNLRAEEANLVDAQSHYQRVIGALPDVLAMPDLPREALPQTMDEAVTLAVANHPTLKSADADIRETDAQYDVAVAPFYPRITAEVAAASMSNLNGVVGLNNDYQAMVRMRYNIFAGGKDEARLAETAHLKNEAKEIRNHTYRQVVEEMRLSWNAHQAVTRQMELYKDHMEAQERTYQAYQQQFNLGERSLLDLLDAVNELYTARTDYTKAVYDELHARSRILASMGTLNSTLQVKLPEEAQPTEAHLLPNAMPDLFGNTPAQGKTPTQAEKPAEAVPAAAAEAAPVAKTESSPALPPVASASESQQAAAGTELYPAAAPIPAASAEPIAAAEPTPAVTPVASANLTQPVSQLDLYPAVERTAAAAPIETAATAKGYVVQVGTFGKQENVQKLQTKLGKLGLPVFTEEHGALTRVYVGPYGNHSEAQNALPSVRAGVRDRVMITQL